MSVIQKGNYSQRESLPMMTVSSPHQNNMEIKLQEHPSPYSIKSKEIGSKIFQRKTMIGN